MIAKQTTGAASSSGKMVDYALREKGLKNPDEKVDIIFQNGCYGSHAEIKEQMKMAMELNKGKCKTPMFHAIFSLAENERLTKDQEIALAESWLGNSNWRTVLCWASNTLPAKTRTTIILFAACRPLTARRFPICTILRYA